MHGLSSTEAAEVSLTHHARFVCSKCRRLCRARPREVAAGPQEVGKAVVVQIDDDRQAQGTPAASPPRPYSYFRGVTRMARKATGPWSPWNSSGPAGRSLPVR